MKSRIRCCGMRSRTTTAASFYRNYLKPGALAQLRNSKITAKSMAKERLNQALVLLSQLDPTSELSLPMSPRANYDAVEVIPCFTLRFKGRHPRCLLRKRLIPVTPVFSES